MSGLPTVIIYLRGLPLTVFEQIQSRAIKEGIKGNDRNAIALWALTQFAKQANNNTPAPAPATTAGAGEEGAKV